jgi:tetratricopeptide (TPR) repeat protein
LIKKLLFEKNRVLLICIALTVAMLVVYSQVRTHDFVNFDDDKYVTENPHVRAGLTWKGITWAFTATRESTWHPFPLAWMSHMLDCQLFGLNPGRHHMTSVFLHAANTLLLFLLLKRMTAHVWRSAFVAALFALHPLHVESVAWLAERKDVLSTFFWMLTIWSYVRYVERPAVHTYLPVPLFFSLGLMAKPMIVTLPFVLLLLDYWPLRRFQSFRSKRSSENSFSLGLVWEKIPLFALAAASSVLTVMATVRFGYAARAFQTYPFKVRLANAIVSYTAYMGKLLWPFRLAPGYPHPGLQPFWKVAGASVLLVSVFILALKLIRQRPYFAVGWLWYLGTLVPVIGLVPVGSHTMADRYTYVPLVGIFIMVAWGIPALVEKLRRWQLGIRTGAAAVLLALAGTSWAQLGYWADSVTLFKHVLDVTGDRNFLAHNNLLVAYLKNGDLHRALPHAHSALHLQPDNYIVYYNIACIYSLQNKTEESVDWLKRAIDRGFRDWEYLKADEDLKNLRESPHFKELRLP